MKRVKAIVTAYSFIKDMNPDFWDGNGKKPGSFKDYPWQCSLNEDVNLEITFVYNEIDGWHHCCDLVSKSNNESFNMLSGNSIKSVIDLANTIMDLCKDY